MKVSLIVTDKTGGLFRFERIRPLVR